MATRKLAESLIPSNAELLDRCANGDEDAWTTIIGRYERLVYAIPRKEGLSLEASADVTQHTFAELVRQFGSISEPDRLSYWLMTVCRREVWRIKTSERPTIDLTMHDLPAAWTDVDFTDTLALTHEVYDAVQALGEPCRSLILGLFFDPSEPDYSAIAITLGRPVGSVGPLRGRCLARLRVLIQNARSVV